MEKQFYQKLLQLVQNASSARFLLAVSGGRDSVVLTHLALSCNLKFDIAHCNFHLRGKESDQEMHFVKKLPFLTNQKVFVKEFDTISLQQNSGKSIEMVARELRYRWFDEIGKDYEFIVTAHHANDNAETMIINLLRGTGLRGLCGIPSKNGKIIRPLLPFTTNDIEKYAKKNHLEFCVDSSNLEDSFLRNKIRHYIIPELEKITPHVIETFYRNSTLFQQQTQLLDTHIQQYKNQLLKKNDKKITIEINELKKIENFSLVLYEMLNPFGFNAYDVENILKSMHANPGKRFLSDTHILVKDRTHFIMKEIENEKDDIVLIHKIEELEKHGFIVEKKRYYPNFKSIKSSNTIYLDAEKLKFPLTLRGWNKGDFFYPFGMKTKKKLSNFFTDLKIDLLEKQKIRLLCSQNQIVWVVNYRADDRFRVEENTNEYYKIVKPECKKQKVCP